MSFSWSFNPKTAPVGFVSWFVVLILVILSFLDIGEKFSFNIQFSLLILFCLALGFAVFSLVKEQSKSFGAMALVMGAMAFAFPLILFLWFPGMLRH